MTIWIHKKTGNRYDIVSDNARMKVNGEWVDCVIYRPLYANKYEMFAREKNSFYQEFEKENAHQDMIDAHILAVKICKDRGINAEIVEL